MEKVVAKCKALGAKSANYVQGRVMLVSSCAYAYSSL